ncbi:Gfo/Idh/MocA family protein [Actinophytocola xanthii]|uniref:Oxidoreductase n=1 Tax=Actinophytocola xanthii TaxID=1912961 RepID=A0A1Q8BT80_9PSEU|nr:Gfo/Idh/MocA family oxidoreductase [Actinophytocola xanthii]OLF05305.1 oxidoreductase [Actinophytocola xanthii]
MRPLRTAVIGFGTSGRVFHTPFIAANPDFALTAVVTGDERRRAEVRARYPRTEVVPRVDALPEVDVVVIGTPPVTHAGLAHRFLDARVAVVVDKPFTVTSSDGWALVEKAARLAVPLTVFQNRRFDGDFRTVERLLADGELGEVWRFESRFEWWKPDRGGSWKTSTPVSEGGGILYDLGTHTIDQAVRLFGGAEPVYHELFTRGGGAAPDDAFVVLRHVSGVVSHLWMNGLAAQVGPRFRVLGSRGGFTKYGLDPQESALRAGASPSDQSFGREPEANWGTAGLDGELRAVPTKPGRYAEFYTLLASALRSGDPLPVDPLDSVRVLELVERLR